MAFSRESLLKSKLKRDIILTSDGEEVHLIEMNGTLRERFEAVIWPLVTEKSPLTRAAVAAFSICDPEGNLIFTEADIPELSQMPGIDLLKINSVASELSKIRSEDYEALAKKS